MMSVVASAATSSSLTFPLVMTEEDSLHDDGIYGYRFAIRQLIRYPSGAGE